MFISPEVFPEDTVKTAFITRTELPPGIDGIMDEEWKAAAPITDFIQFKPYYNVPPSQRTEVRLLYDNNAIYVFAVMYDTNPDSILMQLGNRDEHNLNADLFGVEFDTYNNQLDAYSFIVSSSGVQQDYRFADESYNAVWESKTLLTDTGWVAEIKIPYPAIRFPAIREMAWGMQIYRYIRRNRETNYWALQLKGSENHLVYFGKLKGISNIKAPLRLSFNPYLSAGISTFSEKNFKDSEISKLFSGGLDLKYGINESFTLDVTLLPDFSQVQSDNKVKNLSAFETVYDEQRPFFNEAVDLFSKDELFYSRRIGRTPRLFYSVASMLDSGETIKNNPSTAKLVNATKFSGRNKKGLAAGIFNAVTNDTWATVEQSNGTTRRILTEPFANYNIFVLDQAMKNNSSFYLTNTNFLRRNGYYNSNVTAGGLTLYDKTNTWSVWAGGGLSKFYYINSNHSEQALQGDGKKYWVGSGKTNGKFKFFANHYVKDKNYNPNDAGLSLQNNFINNNFSISYNIYEPFWKMRELYNNVYFNNNFDYTTKKITALSINTNVWGTFNNYLSVWGNSMFMLSDVYNYYETRTEGRYFINKKTSGFSLGLSSDYRKSFAVDANAGIYETPGYDDHFKQISISPVVRLSNHFSFRYSFNFNYQDNEKGWVANRNDSVIFGNRDITTITNTFSGNYIFKNDLSLSIRVRHYWSKGLYSDYYFLNYDGTLDLLENNPGLNADFNFNSFNIDMVFNWQFAPGSYLNLIWKKEILSDSDVVIHNFMKNFSNALEQPQYNTFSIKAIYYLDYQYLAKRK